MIIKLKVKPNSKADALLREADGSLKLKIKAPPVDGKANAYLVRFLSKALNIAASNISIKSGTSSGLKLIEIDADEIETKAKIEALLRGA